ncbi:MAG: M28 family metallopeptidase [Halioglobus sp.]
MKYLLVISGLFFFLSSLIQAETLSQGAAEAQLTKDLHLHTAELASDAYEGREPGTAGEQKTVSYLAKEFEKLGLAPGNSGSWYQQVPITAVTSNPDVIMKMRGTGVSLDLAYSLDMMAATQRQVKSVGLKNSQLVFAGYGIVAPERNWNDYAEIDVSGKTVVVLINDPGFATQNPKLFNGNAMTYYGRWDYKYAEAARQGASGVIIVHETAPASYPWEVVANSWSGANIGLTADNRNVDKLQVEAWITFEQAEKLFASVGMDYAESKNAAAIAGFRASDMGDIKVSVSLTNTISTAKSRNVLAAIPGSKYPEEAIVYSAHWDHLGIRPGVEGDNIYNGAADNASGVAALLGLARLFSEQSVAPQRTVLFLAVTAEESGLLGSKWYSENPVFPIAKTVANLNMDNLAKGAIGKTHDVAVVGFGNSELENYLGEAAKIQGREVVQEPAPEKGLYYRSDHFSFARVGIPALYLTTATDSIEHGKAWGDQRLVDYYANDYHKPSDEYLKSWDLSGASQDVMLLYTIGAKLSSSRDFPNWNTGNEFKATRDASMAVSH